MCCYPIVCGIAAYALTVCTLPAQIPLQIDTTFRLNFHDKWAGDVLPINDGSLLLSGQLREEGELTFKSMVKVDSNGDWITSFPGTLNTAGGGKMTKWNDKIYVAAAYAVRRLDADGFVDPSFILMNSGPYFTAGQTGDYHVYPDGRVLLSGLHDLQDPVRGFDGPYNLIWFSNTGYLDTTRTHRTSNGITNEIEALANGQFLVGGTGSHYEGEPVGRIFRINADGSLDPTLQTGINWGAAYSFLPLADGRFYAAGTFRRAGFPNDTLRLVRFLPTGDLDPSFNNNIPFGVGEISGPFGALPTQIQSWNNGSILVMGAFQFADDQPRRGICVIDSAGVLMPEFDGCGVGTFTVANFTDGSVSGYMETEDDMAYIWGAYHGYNDGTTNDTLQRFVTRLYGPDFTTAVVEDVDEQGTFSLFPNPANGTVQLTLPQENRSRTLQVRLRDASGRSVLEQRSVNPGQSVEIDLGRLASGLYLVELLEDGLTRHPQRLVVQH